MLGKCGILFTYAIHNISSHVMIEVTSSFINHQGARLTMFSYLRALEKLSYRAKHKANLFKHYVLMSSFTTKLSAVACR